MTSRFFGPLAIAVFGAILVGAANPKDVIMNEVEKQVQMPEGAFALSTYVRNYTYFRDGTVMGIYVLPPLTKQSPGRSWVDFKMMPFIQGGGCQVMTIFYNPHSHAVTDTRCNFRQ